MQLTALLVWLLWSQVFDLRGKKNKSVSFISVCDCGALGNIYSVESRAAQKWKEL